MGDPTPQPGMLKLVFEDNCVVVNDTEEYYFDSIDALKTVGQLCAFLEGQETFPKDKKVFPFSVKGRKIGSKEAAASTVAFIRIDAAEESAPSPAPAPAVAKPAPKPAPAEAPSVASPKAARPLPNPGTRPLPKQPVAEPLNELEDTTPPPVQTPPKPAAKKPAAPAVSKPVAVPAPVAAPPDEEIDDDLQELYQDAKMATLRRGAQPPGPAPSTSPSKPQTAQAQYSLLFDDPEIPPAPVPKGLKKAAAKPAGVSPEEQLEQEEAIRAAQEEAKRAQEEARRAAEEARRKQEEERKAAEEAKRAADEEKQRRIREERLRRQEEERKRQEEEDRKREEEKKRKEEERLKKLKQAEAERKRQADLEEQKKKEADSILNKLEEQRRRVQEREKEQAEEERKKKEAEDARRKQIEDDKIRRQEEAAAAERKRKEQEEILKKKLDETAQKRIEDARRKQQEEEEALRAIEEERAEEERLRKLADDERRRKEKAEKAALRFSSFMKQLQGVPEEEIFKELEAEDKEKNELEEIDRQLKAEKHTVGAKTMAEGGQATKLKYYSKFDRAGGADGRKPRKGGMRQHLKNIEYRHKRSKLHQKLEQDREVKRKEEDDRKRQETEVLAKLQRQQQRINELGGRSRISVMLKQTMGKGSAQAKAKQLAGNDKAMSMLDELETMIEEEEKKEKDEFSALKKKMDMKRAGKDLAALGDKTQQGRASSSGSPSTGTSAPSSDANARSVASPQRMGAPPSPPMPKISEPAEEAPSTNGDHSGRGSSGGGGDASVLDELDALVKMQVAAKEKQQEFSTTSRGSAGKPLPPPPGKKKPVEPESPPAAATLAAPAAKDRSRIERFSVLLQNLAIDPVDIPPAADGGSVDDGALDMLDDLIEPRKSPRGPSEDDAPPELPPMPPQPSEDELRLEEERANLREEEERLRKMEEEALRKKKERLSRTSMKLEAARAKGSFEPLTMGAPPAAPGETNTVPMSPRGGGDAFMRELAELERQQAEQLRALQAMDGGLPDEPPADSTDFGFDPKRQSAEPMHAPLDTRPPSLPPPQDPPLEDDLPPEEDEEPLTGPIDPARAAPEICYTCGIRVDESPGAPEPLRALDRLWHKECWVCYECKMPLLGSRFGADGPFIYCESDYQRKFFCAACGQMITDHNSKVAEGRFYHSNCFAERNDEQDSDFKAWMENFSKVREGAPSTSPRTSQQTIPGTGTMTAAASAAVSGMGIETEGGLGGMLPPPRMSMMPPPPPPDSEPPVPPTANPRHSEKPLPEKPLPKPPEKSLPPKPPAGGSPIKPGAVTPGSTPLPELTRELSKTISFREGPKVIQSPKDIVALEQPEKYLFQVTLPTAAHGMEAEKAGFTVKIFDVRGNNVIVTRKYKDFRNMYDELSSKHYPKAKVPKVPKLKDKDKVKTEHATEVESFLNLCGHLNGIWQVPCMRAFISGEDPRKQKNANEIVIGRPIDFKHVAHMGSTK